jgi:hypothetical protein
VKTPPTHAHPAFRAPCLGRTAWPRHAAAWQPPCVPLVIVRRRRAVADETPVERLQQDERQRPRRPARGADGVREHRERCEAAGRGVAWQARAENEVHRHHLVDRVVRERPVRAENRCCRRRVRLATELGRVMSSRTRLSRVRPNLYLHGSIAVCKTGRALEAQP